MQDRATLEDKERTSKAIQRLSALLPRFQVWVALPGFHQARQLPTKAVGTLSPKALGGWCCQKCGDQSLPNRVLGECLLPLGLGRMEPPGAVTQAEGLS